MSLIPRMPAEPERDVLSVRVPATLIEQLREYASFVRGTKDYVITAALDRLFKQDREFIQWKQSHTGSADKAASTARAAAPPSARAATTSPTQQSIAGDPANATAAPAPPSPTRSTTSNTPPRTTPKATE